MSKDDADKIEKVNEIAGIAELIFYFNNEDQEGSGLKILTASQMLTPFFFTNNPFLTLAPKID